MNLCHLPSLSNVSIYANMQSWPDSAYFCYIFRLITVHIFKKNYCIKLTCLIIGQYIKEKMAGGTGTCFTFLETVLSSDSTYLIHLYIMFYVCVFVIQTDVMVTEKWIHAVQLQYDVNVILAFQTAHIKMLRSLYQHVCVVT